MTASRTSLGGAPDLRRAAHRSYLVQGIKGAVARPGREDAVFGLLAVVLGPVMEALMTQGDEPWLPLRAALYSAAVVLPIRFLYNLWIAPGATERAHADHLGAAYRRAVSDRDEARGEADELRTALGALVRDRPTIVALPLDESQPSVRPLPISTDALRTLALRRIHIVNRGEGTFLRNWEVWTTSPGKEGLSRARVLSAQEWEPMGRALARDTKVPVACQGDEVPAPKNLPIERDIPFVVEGLLPDDVSAPGNIVRVQFTDGTSKPWHYGEQPLVRSAAVTYSSPTARSRRAGNH